MNILDAFCDEIDQAIAATVKPKPFTGARFEMDNGGYKVFDTNGNLRVKVGVWGFPDE